MEAKSSQVERKVPRQKEFYAKLDEESRTYNAEKEIIDMEKQKSVTDHQHYLRFVSGNRAECDCGWGIYLAGDDEIKDGHLYAKGTLIM